LSRPDFLTARLLMMIDATCTLAIYDCLVRQILDTVFCVEAFDGLYLKDGTTMALHII
jgi:hypothetical protein